MDYSVLRKQHKSVSAFYSCYFGWRSGLHCSPKVMPCWWHQFWNTLWKKFFVILPNFLLVTTLLWRRSVHIKQTKPFRSRFSTYCDTWVKRVFHLHDCTTDLLYTCLLCAGIIECFIPARFLSVLQNKTRGRGRCSWNTLKERLRGMWSKRTTKCHFRNSSMHACM